MKSIYAFIHWSCWIIVCIDILLFWLKWKSKSMADPLDRPLKWNKNFQVYVEKHNLYDVFQELLKEMLITKPTDPLVFIKNHITRISKSIYNPRAFILGPNKPAEIIGKRLANAVGAQFITLDSIIRDPSLNTIIRDDLEVFQNGVDTGDEESRKLLISIIMQRVAQNDCVEKGYILYGFPQSKAQAICAQKNGLLPRQVFIFLPDTRPRTDENQNEEEEEGEEEEGDEGEASVGLTESEIELKATASRNLIHNPEGTKMSPDVLELLLKDISTAFHPDLCKVIPFEKTQKSLKADLDAELIGILMTWKPSGAPFVPKVVIMGPPGSGKSSIADYLCKTFSMVNVDWVELVRGAQRWDDKIAVEARAYLKNLIQMTESSVKTIISRRLQKSDCEKKGWVLHGFPENIRHCKLLQTLYLEPNRIFLLSCTQEISASRMSKKKKSVVERELDGVAGKLGNVEKGGHFLIFPFSEVSVEKRYANFAKSLDEITPFYESRIINVDATMKPSEIKKFVETAILRPPIPRNEQKMANL